MSTDTADVHEGTTLFVSGHTTAWSAGARGEMVVVSEGPGGAGYEICDWCGWGRPPARASARRARHPHLLRDTQCTAPLRVASLAHRYLTDFLQIHLDPLTALSATQETLRSGLNALLEGRPLTWRSAGTISTARFTPEPMARRRCCSTTPHRVGQET